jgi:2-dehydropantoate 2-reductase
MIRVCVVGAGAIGMIYAARLESAAGPSRQVVLMTRRRGAARALAEGVTVERPGVGAQTYGVKTQCQSDLDAGTQDVAILATKTFDNDAVLPLVDRMLSPTGACLSVQNGIGVTAQLQAFLGSSRGYSGATVVMGCALGATRVLESAVHATWIPAEMPHLAELVEWMQEAGLNPRVVPGAARIQWQKAAIGVIAGGIAVLLSEPIGQAIRRHGVRDLLREMLREIAAVAGSIGLEFDIRDLEAAQDGMLADVRPETTSSLYVDFDRGTRTEFRDRIEPILRLAAAGDVAVPVVRSLYALTIAKLEARLHPGAVASNSPTAS